MADLLTVPITLMGETRDVVVVAVDGAEGVTGQEFVGRQVGAGAGAGLYRCAVRLVRESWVTGHFAAAGAAVLGYRTDGRVVASDGEAYYVRLDAATVWRGRALQAQAWADRVPQEWVTPTGQQAVRDTHSARV